jgi:hypothetical protein
MPGGLEEAIILDRALEFLPGDAARRKSLSNLTLRLSMRLGEMNDLEEEIILHQRELEFHPSGHPDRFIILNHLVIPMTTLT